MPLGYHLCEPTTRLRRTSMAFEHLEDAGDPLDLAPDASTSSSLAGLNLTNTLVLMACSGKKKPLAAGAVMPLIDLYDGPMWQTLRTHLAGRWAHVVVLSGRYGFTSAYSHLPTYEAKLTTQKADHLIARGLDGKQDRFGELKHVLDTSPLCAMIRPGSAMKSNPDRAWHGVIAAGGGEYRRVFEHMIGAMRASGDIGLDAPVFMTRGGIGEQRSQLGEWIACLGRMELRKR